MNILIITTFYPPDSCIAAVRPYMFARALSQSGNNVTVLRSGELESVPFSEYENVHFCETVSALGKNSPAEQFERGEYQSDKAPAHLVTHSVPKPVRIAVKAARDTLFILKGKPPKCLRHYGTVLKYQKRAIDALYRKGRRYDAVFSTCGSFENIYAGKYAAEVFKAGWIMDYRDSMIMHDSMFDDIWWNKYAKDATVLSLKNADAVTVISQGIADELNGLYPCDKIKVLYNGFDDKEELPEVSAESGVLSFCYTGKLHKDRIPALKAFVKCLSELIEEGKADRSRIRFLYAGPDSEKFAEIFSEAGIKDILTDKGYLSRTETTVLQMSADVFTLFSWNTKKSKGILTGKFYEGIKTRKPILAMLTGNAPGSELLMLQKKYNYGFCYEQCTKAVSMPALKRFITELYSEKMTRGRLERKPSKELYEAFSYSFLSKKLHSILLDLTAEKAKASEREEK